MAVIKGKSVEGGGDFDKRQVVRLSNGLYGGLFSWYSLPKEVQKWKSDETEKKFYVGWVITHDRGNQRIPHFSQATMAVRPKLFFNAETGMTSAYVALIYALTGGTIPKEQIVQKEEWDLDEYIGRPAILFIKEGAQPGRDGNYMSRVTSLEPADADLIKKIKPLYKERKIETTENEGIKMSRLVYPAPAFADDVQEDYQGKATDTASLDDDEIPF